MIYCFPCHCHLRTGPPVLSAKCILMTFGWLPSTILVSMWVEVKTDSVHIKPTHSFQTRAQAAVNTNPNSPQKWQSFCTLTCKRSPALKGVAMGQGGSQSRGLFTPELFLHAWLRSYKSVSRALFLYWVNGCMVEKTFRLSLDQWLSKGSTCASSVSSAWDRLEMTGLQSGARISKDGVRQAVL